MRHNDGARGQVHAGRYIEYFSWVIPRQHNTPGQYLYALILTLLALAARLLIAPLDGGIQYITFFPTVAISAVIGGFWPGMLTAVISAILASYLFWPPYQVLVFEFGKEMVISNLVFLFDALLVCTAIEALHRFHRKFTDAESELQLSASILKNSAEGVMLTDASGTIQMVNPAFSEITGYSEEEALGRKPNMLRSDHQRPEFYRDMWETLNREGQWQGELWNRRKNGEAYLQWLSINRIQDGKASPVRYVGVFHDVTESRQKDEQIRHLAFHDPLTKLPNRALILDRIGHALQRARRERGRLALAFIDLDRFKSINDTLGHDLGDLLLQEVAIRIKRRLREMDTVARLGGDEFLILMEDLHVTEDCAALAKSLIDEISLPMSLKGHSTQVGASIGIAFFPEDGSDSQSLMKHADMAMYAAKSGGRNTYHFFRPQLLEQAIHRMSIDTELRQALKNGELELHYQPKIELTSGTLVGVEALVRWMHPTRGNMSPQEFIPLAEESDLILDVGGWVVDSACRQAAQWLSDGHPVKVAVNLTARQLDQGNVYEHIADCASRYNLPASAIEVEVTESMLMSDPDHAINQLSRLREVGATVAVDDFGTGYSSLAYLRRLPLDVIKIDRSFVINSEYNDEDLEIVKTIVALGHTLKLTVLAEGIENSRQLDLLKSIGCHCGQGYHISPPLPADQFEDWIQKYNLYPPVA